MKSWCGSRRKQLINGKVCPARDEIPTPTPEGSLDVRQTQSVLPNLNYQHFVNLLATWKSAADEFGSMNSDAENYIGKVTTEGAIVENIEKS